jgi:hypothetical protein
VGMTGLSCVTNGTCPLGAITPWVVVMLPCATAGDGSNAAEMIAKLMQAMTTNRLADALWLLIVVSPSLRLQLTGLRKGEWVTRVGRWRSFFRFDGVVTVW